MVKIILPREREWVIRLVSSDDAKLIVDGEKSWGATYFKSRIIYIDQSLDCTTRGEVLRHEITHAVIYETQFTQKHKYSEEDICDFVGMYGTIIHKLAHDVFEQWVSGVEDDEV